MDILKRIKKNEEKKVNEMEKTIEKPKNTMDRKIQRIVYDKESDSWKVEQTTKTFNFDPIHQKKLGNRPISEKVEYLPLSVLGEAEPVKSVVIPCLIRKTGYDSLLNEISVYVVRQFEISVLSDPIYKHLYLRKDLTKIHVLPFKVDLNSGICAPVQYRGNEQGLVKGFISEEALITEKEAYEFKRNGALQLIRKGDSYELASIT